MSDNKPRLDEIIVLLKELPYSQGADLRAFLQDVHTEARTDRDQTHGHNRFWAEFWTRTCLLVSLAGGGLLVAVLNGDAILRTGGMSVFSGVAGAVIQREASHHRRNGNLHS